MREFLIALDISMDNSVKDVIIIGLGAALVWCHLRKSPVASTIVKAVAAGSTLWLLVTWAGHAVLFSVVADGTSFFKRKFFEFVRYLTKRGYGVTPVSDEEAQDLRAKGTPVVDGTKEISEPNGSEKLVQKLVSSGILGTPSEAPKSESEPVAEKKTTRSLMNIIEVDDTNTTEGNGTQTIVPIKAITPPQPTAAPVTKPRMTIGEVLDRLGIKGEDFNYVLNFTGGSPRFTESGLRSLRSRVDNEYQVIIAMAISIIIWEDETGKIWRDVLIDSESRASLEALFGSGLKYQYMMTLLHIAIINLREGRDPQDIIKRLRYLNEHALPKRTMAAADVVPVQPLPTPPPPAAGTADDPNKSYSQRLRDALDLYYESLRDKALQAASTVALISAARAQQKAEL